jgi:hypothetical protein
MMLGPVVYMLCALTAFACAVLLLRAHARSASPLLLWSGLCFACLTLNNVAVVIDLLVLPPDISLFLVRNAIALLGMLLLLYGLIWKAR